MKWLRRAATLLPVPVTGLATLAAAGNLASPLDPDAVGWLITVLAAAFGSCQLLNSAYRPFIGHWHRDVGARRLLAFEAFLGASVLAGGLGAQVAPGLPWLPAMLFAPAFFTYWDAEFAIAEKVRKSGRQLGSAHVERWRPLRALGSDNRLGDSVARAHMTPQGRLLGRVMGGEETSGQSSSRSETPRIAISRPRLIAIALTAITFSLSVAATVAQVMVRRGDGPVVREAENDAAPSDEPERERGASASPTGSASASQVSQLSPHTNQVQWEDLCGPELPGSDAPTWARDDLYHAFLGPGAPGAAVAGCTGPVQTVGTSFAYQEGRSAGGALLSVAVTSTQWPAAIFIAPAAEPVKQLIATEAPIGGTPRLDVAAGDLYLVYSSRGTTALVRAQKAARYVVLPPAAADDWYALMQSQGAWLWPVETVVDAAVGMTRFDFKRTLDAPAVDGSVLYDARTGAAGRRIAGEWVENRAVGQQIALSAIQALARTAR